MSCWYKQYWDKKLFLYYQLYNSSFSKIVITDQVCGQKLKIAEKKNLNQRSY